MSRSIIVSVVACLLLLTLAGCQEQQSDSSLVQRARLVGSENLQLKKQLAEKEQQIAHLNETIEKLETEHAEAMQQSGEANLRLLQMVAEADKTTQELLQENEKLKAELEALKK